MKLEKDFILGGRLKGKRILGIKFGKNTLYVNNSYWSMSYTYNNYSGVTCIPTFNSDFSYTTKTTSNLDSTKTITITAKNAGIVPKFIEFGSITLANYLLSVDSMDDTYGITGISFLDCYELKSIDLSNIDTSTITNMESMFHSCEKLTSLNLSRFNTSKAIYMGYMFYGCNKLTELDLSSFDVKNVVSLYQMFYNCYALQSLNLSNFDIAENTNTSYMLSGCRRLIELRLDNCNNYTIDRIINSNDFPTGTTTISDTRLIYCKESERGDLQPPDGWDFEYVPEEPEIPDVPVDPEPEEPEIPDVPVDPPTPDPEPEEPEKIPLYEKGQFRNNATITEVKVMVDESHDDLSYMFSGCNNLVSVNTEDWDTSNVTNMDSMFKYCLPLAELDVSNWDVSKVTNMSSIFEGCQTLTSLDLSSWITSSAQYMNNMFSNCYNLETLDIRNFKAPSFGQTENIFSCCNKLRVIRMDNCDNTVMRRFIANQEDFPTGDIGVERVIYCKDSSLVDSYGNRLYPPSGWRFEIVPED